RDQVGIDAGVGLHVRVGRAEQLPGVLGGDRLHRVDVAAAGVEPVTDRALGVLVRQPVAHRRQHRRGGVVLARDELQRLTLVGELLGDGVGDPRLDRPDEVEGTAESHGLGRRGHVVSFGAPSPRLPRLRHGRPIAAETRGRVTDRMAPRPPARIRTTAPGRATAGRTLGQGVGGMSRRLVNLTLDTLKDLPHPCRDCVFWELDPVSAQAACTSGDPGLEKEAWVSQTLLEWGSCGKVVYVDSAPAGYVTYAPPSHVPRASAFPTAPASPDAVLLTTAHVVAAYAGGGLGRILIQGAARDLVKRGFKAIEAFGDARYGEPAEDGRHHRGPCVAPADFFLAVGFKTARPHPRYPRL